MKHTELSIFTDQLHDMTSLHQEHFICFSIGSRGNVIAKHTVFIGTLTSVQVHPREIFAAAVADHAAAVVLAHNHPSGDCTPSKQDIATTQQLVAAGQILGIPVQDHVIVTEQGSFSFLGNGLMVANSSPQGLGIGVSDVNTSLCGTDILKLMPRKKPQPQPMHQPQELIKHIPKWVYIVSAAIVIIALLSKTPGGQDLTILIPWIVGWSVTIWLFRRFKLFRTVTIALLIITVILYIVAYFIGQAALKIGGY